ncbi:hypothetical protein [uncultured Thiodictyon sp.]|uniref:hypothetical protein n=1 Tax=uncultured Thiodictyon sp. TaxID=1846217 RepID=UPI0025F341E7|nr:hypothetical protein [uncultured Thiodictyon sp.]
MTAVNYAIFGDPPKRPEKPRPPLRDQFDFSQLEKDPFETTEEHRARVAALLAEPIVIGDLVLKSEHYDADRREFRIDVELNQWIKDHSTARLDDIWIEIAPAAARSLFNDCQDRTVVASFEAPDNAWNERGILLRLGGSVRIFITALRVSAYDRADGRKLEYLCLQGADEERWADVVANSNGQTKLIEKYLASGDILVQHLR